MATNRNNRDEQIKTVLVVEDKPSNLRYLVFLLKRLGFNTVTAYTGEDALEVLKVNHIDCLLLDIHLGQGMSGLVLMEKLREKEEYKDTPIAAVTAYFGGGMSEFLLERGFSDFLAKPFTINQLRELLAKYFPAAP
jgi:CheY-like chemotaxis protein